MQKLTFTKQSILISFWDETSEKWIERNMADASLPITWYLPYEVHIEKNVTLRDIINMLIPYSEQLNFVFLAYLNGVQVEDLFAELLSRPAEPHDLKIDAICLLWMGQVKPVPEIDDLKIYTFPALLALEIIDEDDDGSEDELHSIYDITVDQLLDKSIVIDDFLEYYDDDKHNDALFSGITDWQFFDFIRTILSELVLYSFTTDIIKKSDLNTDPIGPAELFEHLDKLDKFFKDEPTDLS
jgi:hypothetical protein